MTTKTKRILIISGLAILVLAAGSYVTKSKIMGLIKRNDNKRVAAQQSADIKEIPWTATENTNQAMIDYLHKK